MHHHERVDEDAEDEGARDENSPARSLQGKMALEEKVRRDHPETDEREGRQEYHEVQQGIEKRRYTERLARGEVKRRDWHPCRTGQVGGDEGEEQEDGGEERNRTNDPPFPGLQFGQRTRKEESGGAPEEEGRQEEDAGIPDHL